MIRPPDLNLSDLELAFFLMAGDTIGCRRFFYTHCLVALHALAMVGCHQSWLERILLIKRLAVATGATRRLFGRRAMMMAALAEHILVLMKIADQSAVFYITGQGPDNFTMR